MDNLSNSKLETLDKLNQIVGRDIECFIENVTNNEVMERIFSENRFDGIIHFAGYKSVGESVEEPLRYYFNNLVSSILLACLEI